MKTTLPRRWTLVACLLMLGVLPDLPEVQSKTFQGVMRIYSDAPDRSSLEATAKHIERLRGEVEEDEGGGLRSKEEELVGCARALSGGSAF